MYSGDNPFNQNRFVSSKRNVLPKPFIMEKRPILSNNILRNSNVSNMSKLAPKRPKNSVVTKTQNVVITRVIDTSKKQSSNSYLYGNLQSYSPWNMEEDTILTKHIVKYGENNWDRVSIEMVKRTPHECWLRWSQIRKKIFDDILKNSKEIQFSKFGIANKIGKQKTCCINNCKNEVKNRSRFSLRCEYKFKDEYIKKQWNKICTKHYFADLYKSKKARLKKPISARRNAK